MAELTNKLKLEVVLRLARFEKAADVARWLKADYGLDCPISQLVQYDASKPAFTASDKYRQVFEAGRKAFLHDVAVVPAAQQAYRLNMLQRGVESAASKGNWPLVAQLLEQAAKEVGGAYTNIRVNVGDFGNLSAAERRQQLAGVIDRVFGREEGQAPAPATVQ